MVANVPKSKEVWTINDSNGSIDFLRGNLPTSIYFQNIFQGFYQDSLEYFAI